MPKINCEKETEKIVKWIQKTFKEKGFSRAVIGISGGLDSAVVANLLVRALGKHKVYGYMLPYGEQKDLSDSMECCKWLDIWYSIINIFPFVNNYFESLGIVMEKLRTGNIQARTRMIVMYDMSYVNEALVVGTGNKTELMLGYFTLHGDGACAMEPMGHLYKTEVKELAKYLEVPKQIINKAPSAGLWEGQTDEQELGMTYKEIDKILKIYNSMMYDPNNWRDHSKKEIIKASIYTHKELDAQKIEKIIDIVEKNKFKNRMPESMYIRIGECGE